MYAFIIVKQPTSSMWQMNKNTTCRFYQSIHFKNVDWPRFKLNGKEYTNQDSQTILWNDLTYNKNTRLFNSKYKLDSTKD